MKIQSFICERCGVTASRPLVRGQRPKWCSNQCRNAKALRDITCEWCGLTVEGWNRQRFCSRSCVNSERASRAKPKVPAKTADEVAAARLAMLSPLRRALETSDHAGVITAVKAGTREVDGCWVWQRKIRDGYPTISVAGKTRFVHRLVLEAKHEAPLGSQAGHHICANTSCVNPDHLQPVTHRDNVAEMLARKAYLNRIRELEDALATIEPSHPLLQLVEVA